MRGGLWSGRHGGWHGVTRTIAAWVGGAGDLRAIPPAVHAVAYLGAWQHIGQLGQWLNVQATLHLPDSPAADAPPAPMTAPLSVPADPSPVTLVPVPFFIVRGGRATVEDVAQMASMDAATQPRLPAVTGRKHANLAGVASSLGIDSTTPLNITRSLAIVRRLLQHFELRPDRLDKTTHMVSQVYLDWEADLHDFIASLALECPAGVDAALDGWLPRTTHDHWQPDSTNRDSMEAM